MVIEENLSFADQPIANRRSKTKKKCIVTVKLVAILRYSLVTATSCLTPFLLFRYTHTIFSGNFSRQLARKNIHGIHKLKKKVERNEPQ